MARTALGGTIELDPMSEMIFNRTVKAQRYYTESHGEVHCGLTQPWDSRTILINPAGGLVLEAWRKLISEYQIHGFKAIWFGFSVEQLCVLASEPRHPVDYSLLYCRQRIDFTTPHPRRMIVERGPESVLLECGHTDQCSKLTSKLLKTIRCKQCTCDPESNGAPSHGNYVVGVGVPVADFEHAFEGRGKFSNGWLAVDQPVHQAGNPNQLELFV